MDRSKLIETALNSTISGIISFFLPLILSSGYSAIISSIYKVSIIDVMANIPLYVYFIFFIPFCCWIVCKYIKRKMNEGIKVVRVSLSHKNVDFDEIEYNDLVWLVKVDEGSLRFFQNNYHWDKYDASYKIINNVAIDFNPKCPKCGAELYFTPNELWYTYDCVNPECSFIKRTWQSRDKMREIAKKLYKFKLESEFFNKKDGD